MNTNLSYVPYIVFLLTLLLEMEEGSSDVCSCPCSSVSSTWNYINSQNMTQEEANDYLKKILEALQEDLFINPEDTSAYINTKISAQDQRFSSAVIGWFGGVMLCIPFILCFCSDILRLCTHKRIKEN